MVRHDKIYIIHSYHSGKKVSLDQSHRWKNPAFWKRKAKHKNTR